MSLLRLSFVTLLLLSLTVLMRPPSAQAATFTVTSTLDDGSAGTLRWALDQANSTAGNDTITFNIAAGLQTINLVAALPAITETVTIDALTQPGGATCTSPLVVLNGTAAGVNVSGLVVQGVNASNSTIQGLVIQGFSSSNLSYGILLDDTNNTTVRCNFLGTNATGTAAVANFDGLSVQGTSTGNIVRDNLAAGNLASGISLLSGSSNTTMIGNRVGTNLSGTAALANAANGVYLNQTSGNVIGGAATGEGNLIAGNMDTAVYIGESDNNRVFGNLIGTDINGTTAIPNRRGVLLINGSDNNQVGGLNTGERNVIAGSTNNGVVINGSSDNLVAGNLIGTNAAGTAALSNGDGIFVQGTATRNTLRGNLISGNRLSGIALVGTGVTNTTIAGNRLGTNLNGDAALANAQNGLYISQVSGTVIGGTTAADRNIISGNTNRGLYIDGANTTNNRVIGNFIGTNSTGTAAIPNLQSGVLIISGANNNQIGGTTAAERNIISGNNGFGVILSNSSDNVISGNFIGTDVNGAAALPNTDGLRMEAGSQRNLLGGTAAGAGNVISGNQNFGVILFSATTTANQILGNLVGTDVTGTLPVPNGLIGVSVQGDAHTNIIGSLAPGGRNIISGNARFGIFLLNTRDNTIAGNYVGTDITGTLPVPNRQDGIGLDDNTQNNQIEFNLISGNTARGIIVTDTLQSNLFTENIIGLNATQSAALPNGLDGIFLQNGGHNSQIISNVIAGNSRYGISLENSDNNVIESNLIGTNGTMAMGNGSHGIHVINGATNNFITSANVIAGNNGHGIYLDVGTISTGNIVDGNFIGTDANLADLGNVQAGIYAATTTDDGDLNLTVRNNIISYNLTGLDFRDAAGGSLVDNNCIVQNTTGAANTSSTAPVDLLVAENNWWGAANGPGPIWVGSGDPVTADIYFVDFLTVAPTINGVTCAVTTPILPGVTVGYSTTSLTTTESGGTATFTLALTIPPTAPVTITLTSSLPTEGRPTPVTLTFTPADWYLPQTVTLTGQDDTLLDGNIPYAIRLGITTTDPVYGSVTLSDVAAINLDNETPQPAGDGGSTRSFKDTDFIIKAVDLTLARIGDTLTYTITFTNPKAQALNHVVVRDTLDRRLSQVRVVSTTGGTATLSGNTVTIQGFSLQPGQQATVVLTAMISTQATVGDSITNVATLESPDASVHISNTVTTLIIPAGLPNTGESPVSRLPLLAISLAGILVSGCAWVVWRGRRVEG